MQSESIKEITAALVKAQSQMGGAIKDRKNDHFKSNYATLESAIDATKEALNSNGIALVQMVGDISGPSDVVNIAGAIVGAFIRVTTTLFHTSGEFIEGTCLMPVKDYTNPQAVGSAITYARRYALMGMCNIAPEDDDGNQAAAKPTAAQLLSAAEAASALMTELTNRVGVFSGDIEKLKALYAEARNSALPPKMKADFLSDLAINIKGLLPSVTQQ